MHNIRKALFGLRFLFRLKNEDFIVGTNQKEELLIFVLEFSLLLISLFVGSWSIRRPVSFSCCWCCFRSLVLLLNSAKGFLRANKAGKDIELRRLLLVPSAVVQPMFRRRFFGGNRLVSNCCCWWDGDFNSALSVCIVAKIEDFGSCGGRGGPLRCWSVILSYLYIRPFAFMVGIWLTWFLCLVFFLWTFQSGKFIKKTFHRNSKKLRQYIDWVLFDETFGLLRVIASSLTWDDEQK